ncbi:hypothetical protein SDC9_172226 [bioreactor metagenome]|uniref:Uncharacterized protein n=1 Tax=bioreactor metagenome TaxID=1076179 RepID=A0A645GFL2_9ZZZZ
MQRHRRLPVVFAVENAEILAVSRVDLRSFDVDRVQRFVRVAVLVFDGEGELLELVLIRRAGEVDRRLGRRRDRDGDVGHLRERGVGVRRAGAGLRRVGVRRLHAEFYFSAEIRRRLYIGVGIFKIDALLHSHEPCASRAFAALEFHRASGKGKLGSEVGHRERYLFGAVFVIIGLHDQLSQLDSVSLGLRFSVSERFVRRIIDGDGVGDAVYGDGELNISGPR